RAAPAPVEGREPTLPVEADGRVPAVGWVEARAPPELQPRASAVRAEAAALGAPLERTRLWSGCHFFCVPAWAALARVLTLALRLTLTFLLTSMSTSP